MVVALTRPFTLTTEDGTVIGYQAIGSGAGLILVGGAALTARDYLPLAQILALSHTVYVPDRRGRGVSGPQGPGYSIETECQDLLALQRHTGATLVFGHGYGGLIALETAQRWNVFRKIAVYEPGLSIGGSVPPGWLAEYRDRLDAGDTRGAFACMVSQAGYAPGSLTAMPPRALRAFLRLHTPRQLWQGTEPLLRATLAENEQIARLDDGTADRYADIVSPVMLLGGSLSPAFSIAGIDTLNGIIAGSAVEIVDGLGHNAPVRKPPLAVAQRILRFLRPPGGPSRPKGISPSSRARATASVRLTAPSLPSRWPTCFLTVSRLTTNSRAMRPARPQAPRGRRSSGGSCGS